MEYTDLEKASLESNKFAENVSVKMFTNSDDDDDYASSEELADLEDTMFPDGVDDDNYPDLSDSD